MTAIAVGPGRSKSRERIATALVIEGRVQGVGFRPFVYVLATRHGIAGSVRNLEGRVLIHAEGAADDIATFAAALIAEAPPLARPRLASSTPADVTDADGFAILASVTAGDADVHLPPDNFVCPDCLAEMRKPDDRRYRYPFITCTQCGPRYTIIEHLPYDRANTSMADFELCPACRAEYDDPRSRRFHAEPLGCAACGPGLTFVEGARDEPLREMRTVRDNEAALAATADVIEAGGIVAVKGVGGYHLLCDAASDAAVEALRMRKRRPTKPLAVMYPDAGVDGLARVRVDVDLDDDEARLLSSPARPIVLASRRPECRLSPLIAPGLAEIGVLLPYSPLHALLLDRLARPLVATSGNVSGEPVITDADEAERRLANVADAFLHHNRPILRPADDSVYRKLDHRARAVRLGRGIAPLELPLLHALSEPVLALGGEMKAALALGIGKRAVLGPHIGEMSSPRAFDVMVGFAGDMPRLHGVAPARLACDAHAGYTSTRWAERQGLPLVKVQHHAAHASALAGEHAAIDRWLVFTWDGVGLGGDGTLWGGEALLGAPGAWQRVASFITFRPLGGDKASREPWCSAAALLWQAGCKYAPPAGVDPAVARAVWDRAINSPETSAVGRLFDAAAALICDTTRVSYEGEGPMQLEALASTASDAAAARVAKALPLVADAQGIIRANWSALLDALVDESVPRDVRARAFHLTMAETIVAKVTAVQALPGSPAIDAVGLTGGVFQNRLLAEAVISRLRARGLAVHMPSEVPANDGGLAYGQLVEAAAVLAHRARDGGTGAT